MNRFNCSAPWSTGTAKPHTGDGHAIVVLKPCARVQVRLMHGEEEVTRAHLSEPGIVYVAPEWHLEVSGAYDMKQLAADAVCLLVAFVDAALEASRPDAPARRVTPPCAPCFVAIDAAVCEDDRSFERCLIADVLSGVSNVADLARRAEAYWLMRFVIEAGATSTKLQDMCRKYGLSYSYFRKKCRAVMGEPVKAKLCEWRAARSALDMVQGAGSILDIALENGFSSASHISREFKSRFGVSPTTFAKSDRLWAAQGIKHAH